MLDSENSDDLATVEAPEPDLGEIESEGQDDLVITIEGEDAEEEAADEELGPKGQQALAAARKAAREAASKARSLEAELAEARAMSAPKDAVIERPTLEACGFDPDLLEKKLEVYLVAQSEVKAKAAAREAEMKAADDDYQARLAKYATEKKAIKVDDFDGLEDAVRGALTKEQQSVMVRNVENLAHVIAALGKSKKALAELTAEKDIDRFAYRLAKLEGKITVTTKAPPPPETKLRGGGGIAVAQVSMEKLKERAESSGDYTEYFAAKRRLAAKAK
jgi:hypothetical protein